jgi:hypothetical protein
VNSSLVQSKMTSNNFEIWWRDMDLSEIFSGMWFIVEKKVPPILNLKNFIKDKKAVEESHQMAWKQLHCKRLEAVWKDCKRENDITIFRNTSKHEKNVSDSIELGTNALIQKENELSIALKQASRLNSFIDTSIQKDHQITETEELYNDFLEIEWFVWNLQSYATDLETIVKTLRKTPVHP